MPLIAIGMNHRSSPVEVRERFAFEEKEIPATLEELRSRGLVSEGVIVSTCNRVELYAVIEGHEREALDNIRAYLIEKRRYDKTLNGEFYLYSEPGSLEHLFKVACGLDSMLLGETEIL